MHFCPATEWWERRDENTEIMTLLSMHTLQFSLSFKVPNENLTCGADYLSFQVIEVVMPSLCPLF